jgi:hypothetical protein
LRAIEQLQRDGADPRNGEADGLMRRYLELSNRIEETEQLWQRKKK